MTYKELKEFLNKLSPEQLEQPATIFNEDQEQGHEIDDYNVSDEDIFWLDGDCYGDRKTTDEQILEMNEHEKLDDPYTIDDFLRIPKGTVTLWYKGNL